MLSWKSAVPNWFNFLAFCCIGQWAPLVTNMGRGLFLQIFAASVSMHEATTLSESLAVLLFSKLRLAKRL